MLAAFLAPGIALRFLTILPPRMPLAIPDGTYPNAVAAFPLVGLALGILVALIDAGVSRVTSAAVAAAIDLAVLAVASGGLHLDGIADSADGLLGDLPRERRLEVMREPGIGAFGVVAVALVLLIEYTALMSLGPAVRVAALVVSVTLSRWTMSLLLAAFPYARPEGLGTAFRSGLGAGQIVIACLTALAVVFLLFAWPGLLLLVAAAAVALAVGGYAVRRLGGCTGDVYGAGGELAFAAALVTAVGIAR